MRILRALEPSVRSRFGQISLAAALVLLNIIAAQPYIERGLYASTTPRSNAPRASLADFENSAITILERVSPSVVQVAARGPSAVVEENANRASSGTGFVWDGAGHIITNDHVVQGASQLAV